MKVLIADDSATSRTMLRSALTRWGYEVVLAENGKEALDILSTDDPPHMAVLDWVMPELTGPEVCRRVRGTLREPYTYILLLTSKNSKGETVEGLEAGADDYVVKPFDQLELQYRLRAGQRIIDLQRNLMQAREELRERASKDVLTMLPNRSAISQTLKTSWRVAIGTIARSASFFWISITSKKSTTHTGTLPGTPSCERQPCVCAATCAPTIRWAVMAARNFSWSYPIATWNKPPIKPSECAIACMKPACWWMAASCRSRRASG